jgi:hypothetical protein
MSGRAPLVDAIGAWTGLAPAVVVGLLAVVLLSMVWILARTRR